MNARLKSVIARVESWPAERQEDAASILLAMEEQDANPLRLSEAQLTEVRRRRAVESPQTMTLDELDKRLRRLGV
ncbi:MAG: hypothetical protein U1E56_06550 [Bauldia sp.]